MKAFLGNGWEFVEQRAGVTGHCNVRRWKGAFEWSLYGKMQACRAVISMMDKRNPNIRGTRICARHSR